MATASEILTTAQGEVGYSRWTDPLPGTKYGRWYAGVVRVPYFGSNGVPYCAMFASWVLAQHGMVPPGGIFAYVPAGIQAAGRAGRLVPTTAGRPGDLICFDWNRDGVADHVGIIVAHHGGQTYTTIEGNTSTGSGGSQSNGGRVARRYRSGYVCAIIRPDYQATKPGKLDVDGWWGAATTTAFQRVLGTYPDGIIEGQWKPWRDNFWAITDQTLRWDETGSPMVRALQGLIGGVKRDGLLGPETNRGLQRMVGVSVDGVVGHDTVRAVQSWLNTKLGY